MKVGDRVEILSDEPPYFYCGDRGEIASTNACGSGYFYVRFAAGSRAKLDESNNSWRYADTDLGVWIVHRSCMRVIEPQTDEITELHGFIFDGVTVAGKGEWQPDEAVDDVMDVTRGMFE